MASALRALLSVSDKEGLVDFARGLRDLGFELIGTDGTAKTLREAGLPVTTVADYTGLKEGLGGRVKTLHPRIFAGSLAPSGKEPDLRDLGAVAIDLVVVNLYPFESTVAKPDVSLSEAIENIDIGGVSLIRAAAKNATRVTVVVRPGRYSEVLAALREHGSVPAALREDLALEAFQYTSRYDAAIFNYLASRKGTAMPPALRLAYDKISDLRYGENPYQKAALYGEPFPFAATATAERLNGKELSYNNLIDLDAALRVATEFERPAVVVIKHTNPSGVAVAGRLADAYRAAHDADPISAYGGVVGANRPIDGETAKAMTRHVLDAVIAPGYEPKALEALRAKKKGTFLILQTRGPLPKHHGTDMTRVLGGVLLQTTDFPEPRPESFKVVTKASPTPDQVRDILFGIAVSRYVKSNSIVLVQGERTVGIGAGQMSRVDACMLACLKAKGAARGSIAVSDAYFPFRDGLDELGRAGVAAVAQPGGSIRDEEVIAAADEHGIAMVFTNLRLFKH
ncbi:MAG: bifunctional phosphoribosylaminoimidazolecarboxamide formyltransferase/IMP cyclohydrolase [Methanobacteriota archaeon]|nr:MAG: bifunctional phosphoribosylaminoimidazolecarboxamide formyltransferase/IMP cyclohydrolase [Euryarchaeota archaeon]